MPLSWNKIQSRALAFSREWADAESTACLFKRYLSPTPYQSA